MLLFKIPVSGLIVPILSISAAQSPHLKTTSSHLQYVCYSEAAIGAGCEKSGYVDKNLTTCQFLDKIFHA